MQGFARVTEGISRPFGRPKGISRPFGKPKFICWIILSKDESRYNVTLRCVHLAIVRVEKQ